MIQSSFLKNAFAAFDLDPKVSQRPLVVEFGYYTNCLNKYSDLGQK